MSGLSARDLVVGFGGRTVLDGLSVSLAPGQVTAIVGPNGAGKSTLMSCLAGLLVPDAGEARLDEQPLGRMPARARARRIAFLPQIAEIAWDVEVRTFVGLGRTPRIGPFGLGADDHAAVERALDATLIGPFAERQINTLSGGERARALIARALAGEPDWLLADEPLAGLDPGHALEAVELFRALAAEGRGVVVTLHDLAAAARLADRILVLAEGGIIADGDAAHALSPEVLARAYGVEAQVVAGRAGPLIEIIGRAVS